MKHAFDTNDLSDNSYVSCAFLTANFSSRLSQLGLLGTGRKHVFRLSTQGAESA